MNHDLTLAQLAAIRNADVARVEYHSQAADILRLEVQLRRGEDFPLPWQYGDAVRLLGHGGEVLFCGTCAPPNYDAMTNRWSVEVRSAWADLNRTPLVMLDKNGNPHPANASSQCAPAVCVEWQEFAPNNPLADPLTHFVRRVKYVLPGEEDALLEAHTGAVARNVSVKGLSLADSVVTRCAGFPSGSAGAVSNLNAIVPAVGSNGSSTCGALIRAALEHVPGSVTWSDYSDGGKLNAALAGSLPSLCLDMATGEIAGLGQTGGVTQYSFRRRPDLVPPGVIVFYGTKCHACVPANLDPTSPGVVVVTVQPLQCGTGAIALENGKLDAATAAAVQEATNKYARVRGIALPTAGVVAAGRFWSQLFPWLKDYQSALDVDAPVIKRLEQIEAYPETDDMQSSGVGPIAEASVIRNYSTACGYLLTEGVFTTAKRTGIKFCKGSVTQRVWLNNPDSLNVESAQETGRHFPGYGTHDNKERMYVDFQLTGIFIDRKGYVYRTADNEEVPEEEAEEEESGGGQSQQEAEQEAEEELQRATDAKEAELEYTKRCAEDYYAEVSGERPELHLTLFRPDFWPGALMGKTLSLGNCHPLHAGVATPVLGVVWNLITGEVEVEGGSGAEANFNDMLSVRRALQAAADAALAPLMGEQNFEDTYGEEREEDPEEAEEPEEPEEPEEDEAKGQKIQPNISANASAGAGGQVRQPFSIFQENGSWYMQGGYVPVHNGPPVWLKTTGVSYKAGRVYSVQPRYNRAENKWEAKIRYYDPPSSGGNN